MTDSGSAFPYRGQEYYTTPRESRAIAWQACRRTPRSLSTTRRGAAAKLVSRIAVDPAATDAASVPTASAGDGLRFTMSARGKTSDLPALRFLARNFATVLVASIDSLFGFVESSTFYGGRVYCTPELGPRDVAIMYDVGIGLRLPITNHFETRRSTPRTGRPSPATNVSGTRSS